MFTACKHLFFKIVNIFVKISTIFTENENIENTKSLAVISTYPFLSNNKLFASQRGVVKIDSKTLNDIFSYYMLQTVAMMFNKYDIHTEEKHSIMSEVKNFDYIDWYNNIINYSKNPGIKRFQDFYYLSKSNLSNQAGTVNPVFSSPVHALSSTKPRAVPLLPLYLGAAQN